MMPGMPSQPSDDDLGWSQGRTPEQLAAICAEIRCPVGVRVYVVADPYDTLLTNGDLQGARTGVVVEIAGQPGEPTRGLCAVIPSAPSARTMFGSIFQALLQMDDDVDALSLTADFVLDSWPIFESGSFEHHSEPIIDGSFVDAQEPDAVEKLAGRFTIGEQGPELPPTRGEVAGTRLAPTAGPTVVDVADLEGGRRGEVLDPEYGQRGPE